MHCLGHRSAKAGGLWGALAIVALVIAGCTGLGSAATANARITAVDTCRDSPGQQANDPSVQLVNGVEGFAGDPDPYDLPFRVNLAGHRYLAWKFALAVAPYARPYRTVSIVRPASARLAYPHELAASVRLPACGHRYTLYVGGVFLTKPGCVTLSVTGPAGKPAMVTMPVLVSGC
jgi:hypothetical protein